MLSGGGIHVEVKQSLHEKQVVVSMSMWSTAQRLSHISASLVRQFRHPWAATPPDRPVT